MANMQADPLKRLFELLARCGTNASDEHERALAEVELLRHLREHAARIQVELGVLEAGAESLGARLERRFGASADPGISLAAQAPDTEAASGSSELIRRLAQLAPATTRYHIEGEVARGGMGAILKVWEENLNRHLAMKVLLPGDSAAVAADEPDARSPGVARFLEEAQVTSQLDHPGIVPVHELGLDREGRVYFTMKLVKGRDLRAVYELVFEGTGDWNETRALSILLKVCEAVAYAHRKGVIHRDLKPANVMVGDFGEVYVMDWGLARVLGRADRRDLRIAPAVPASSIRTERREEREGTPDSPLITMDGDVVGTPAYMPPEQARGEIEKLTPRSDVYAIGALLYHLLARQMPYVPTGERITNRTVLARLIDGPPKPLSSLRKDVPAELAAICEKAMARDASLRYADTLELAADLRAYLEHRVVGAYQTGAWAETKKWVQRNRPLAAALGAAIVLLLLGLTTSLVFKTRADDKALEAQDQARIARANAERATAQELIATARAAELALATKSAQDSERLATQKSNEVLSLSAIQELKDLVERAESLWPALPEKLGEYDAWLADARVLIEGRAADPARGIAPHPSMTDHEAKLANIRSHAKPLTPEQIDSDRRASPSLAELEATRAQWTWMRRMLGAEPWQSEAEVEAALALETLPSDAKGVNDMAWRIVDPDSPQVVYGSEIKALLLAQRAVAAATESERANFRDTLAWALYRCGRLHEALAEELRAVDEARASLGSKPPPPGTDLSGENATLWTLNLVENKPQGQVTTSLRQLQEHVALWTTEDARERQCAVEAELSARVAELERVVRERRTFEFDDPQLRWWHAQLAQLVLDLHAFVDEKSGLDSAGISESHGWGVKKRADFARTIEERSVSGREARRLWDAAIAAIASSPKYGGLKLTPQLGLLPIGEDPQSHLWEFAHLQTGDPAVRGADGKLAVTPVTGLVFVLIPGGTFWMGAQRTDPSGRNYDPRANDNEAPVHEVTLGAYLLSKYEMTQGQWMRIAGRNPSTYGPANFAGHASETHPVEQLSWTASMSLMGRLALLIPSEAQWEFGCRGGTDTPWWTGRERESLRGKVNLADKSAKNAGAIWPAIDDWPDYEDGWPLHAPIGSLAANPYGLHEVHGNVREWCRDGYGKYSARRQVDPVTPWADVALRVGRGGSFGGHASDVRSSDRKLLGPKDNDSRSGLRPARLITP